MAASLEKIAYQHIKQDIINAVYMPGDLLSENELAEKLSMSRTPIRSALNQLESEGFIETLKNRGVLVKTISYKDILEMFEILASMQIFVIETAMSRGVTFEFEALEQCLLKQGEAADNGDNRAYYESTMQFTETILSTLNNQNMQHILSSYRDKILTRFLSSRKVRAGSKPFFYYQTNQEIYDALRSSDTERVKTAIKRTVQSIQEQLFIYGLV